MCSEFLTTVSNLANFGVHCAAWALLSVPGALVLTANTTARYTALFLPVGRLLCRMPEKAQSGLFLWADQAWAAPARCARAPKADPFM